MASDSIVHAVQNITILSTTSALLTASFVEGSDAKFTPKIHLMDLELCHHIADMRKTCSSILFAPLTPYWRQAGARELVVEEVRDLEAM